MKFKSYTGMLNDHEKYKEIIDIIENKCHYIEIVLTDEEDSNELVKVFKEDIICEKVVSKWWGTETNTKNKLYKIKASSKLFSKLKQYETFCKYYKSMNGDYTESTDFGYNDIAFIDDNEEPLLFTTQHEGYIAVRGDLII